MNETRTATEAARAMTDLAAKTPIEIDTVLADLDGEYAQIVRDLGGLLNMLHHLAGDHRERVRTGGTTRELWTMGDDDAINLGLENVAAGRIEYGTPERAAQTVADWRAANEALATNRREANRLNDEWHERPWARYIQAGAAGHVHHDVDCAGGTLDRGRYRTERDWRPDLSGLDVAQAIDLLGEWAFDLCSFCFPGAPVPQRPADPDRCPYSGRYVPDNVEQTAPNQVAHWAFCPACKQRRTTTPGGTYRTHNTPAAERRKLEEKAAAAGKIVVGELPNAVIKTVRGAELQATDPYARRDEREPAVIALARHRGETVEVTWAWAEVKRAKRR